MSTSTEKAPNPKILKRNQRIRERYDYLTNTKHLRSDYALKILEGEFLPLEIDTIWLIITRTGFYRDY